MSDITEYFFLKAGDRMVYLRPQQLLVGDAESCNLSFVFDTIDMRTIRNESFINFQNFVFKLVSLERGDEPAKIMINGLTLACVGFDRDGDNYTMDSLIYIDQYKNNNYLYRYAGKLQFGTMKMDPKGEKGDRRLNFQLIKIGEKPSPKDKVIYQLVNRDILAFKNVYFEATDKYVEVDPNMYEYTMKLYNDMLFVNESKVNKNISQIFKIMKQKRSFYNLVHYQANLDHVYRIIYDMENMIYITKQEPDEAEFQTLATLMFYLPIDDNSAYNYKQDFNSDMYCLAPINKVKYQHSEKSDGDNTIILPPQGALNFDANLFAIYLFYYLTVINLFYRGEPVLVPYLVDRPELMFERKVSVEGSNVLLIEIYLRVLVMFNNKYPNNNLKYYHNAQMGLYGVMMNMVSKHGLTDKFEQPNKAYYDVYNKKDHYGLIIMMDKDDFQVDKNMTSYNKFTDLISFFSIHYSTKDRLNVVQKEYQFEN